MVMLNKIDYIKEANHQCNDVSYYKKTYCRPHIKVVSWRIAVSHLIEVASSSPHAAYATFTHGVTSLWTFLYHTTPNIGHLLDPLEDLIRIKLIPTLTGQAPNNLQRSLFTLPTRLGGLNLVSPTSLDFEIQGLHKITPSLNLSHSRTIV